MGEKGKEKQKKTETRRNEQLGHVSP